MRIFIVHEDIYNAGNPYIYTLVEGIIKIDPKIYFGYGRGTFWNDELYSYDIVHFHWPQAFMNGDTHELVDLVGRLNELHRRGIKIVATCHDLKPHYNQCVAQGECMNVVYQSADAILHLGEYSKSIFEKQYPQAKHYILPHHIYDTVYSNIPSREEACRKLNLNPKKKYILCFGTFRAEEEREIVRFVSCRFRNYEILAPGFMDVSTERKFSFIPNRTERKMYVDRFLYRIHMNGRTWNAVPDKLLPYYYVVSDLCFIQRKKILNSGNAILPMLFDRVVVGPDIGNVGLLLKSMGYPTFRIEDEDSIVTAIKSGIALEASGFATKKHNEFMETYSTAVISTRLLQEYKEIVGK